MTEYTRVLVLGAGFGLISLGYVWLLSRAFRAGNWWGTLLFFLPPLFLVYFLLHPRRSWAPVLIMLLGGVGVLVPYGVKYYPRYFIDLGPRVKIVEDGPNPGVHVTLTGWNRTDYGVILGAWPDAVVLQMANNDVTDETLTALAEMKKLRVLDLDDTAVTDEGLKVLGKLPALQVLRLRHTKVTDAGFREHLAPMASLQTVHYRETGLTRTTLNDWKQRKEGRKFLP